MQPELAYPISLLLTIALSELDVDLGELGSLFCDECQITLLLFLRRNLKKV